jgi:hypothetical protein
MLERIGAGFVAHQPDSSRAAKAGNEMTTIEFQHGIFPRDIFMLQPNVAARV